AGALRLEADTDTIGLLPDGHALRRDSDWLEQRLGAYTPLELRVTRDGADTAQFAARLGAWRARVEALPGVARTFTAGDLGAAAPAAVHDSYRSADGRSTRITAYVPMTSARGLARTADEMERAGRDVFGRDDVVEATGYLPLYVRITDYVVQSTVTGLAVAFVVVFAMLALLVRGRRGLLAAMPVNLLPLLVVFGVMGWAGIPLDIATATVGAIVLGIVVDDTIHFLHRYGHEREEGRSPEDAAAASVRHAGRSLVLTSLVLGVGFAVMTAAGTKAIAYFGLVAALAVVGALIADLVLLPVLLGTSLHLRGTVRSGGTSRVFRSAPIGESYAVTEGLRIEHYEGVPPDAFPTPDWPAADREPPAPDAAWALAFQGDRLVARLATYFRDDLTGAPGRSGIIGHFDAVDAQAGTDLLGVVVAGLNAEGAVRVIGPMNGSTWHRYRLALPAEAGDVDAPPFLGEPLNPGGYPAMFAAAGFHVAASYESRISTDLGTENPRARAAEEALAARGITIAPVDLARFDDELADLHALSVRAFPENRYYSPIAVDEFRALYTPMRAMIDPALVLLARGPERQLVAYVFAYVDPLSARDGRPTRLIVKTLATDPAWRGIGLGAVLVERLHDAARSRGLDAIIHALMHADNNSVKISAHTAQVCRRYVLYEHDGGGSG
ncbi:MAG: GNAT family N-acetyltransferase, partial [Gemmatimonadaceae bacterium]|nr:GNAT family N-acetyltransferase [Gemmatimonadaceae bacterium]